MKLRRWDVVFVRVEPSDATGHPGIILSHDGILGAVDRVRPLVANVPFRLDSELAYSGLTPSDRPG